MTYSEVKEALENGFISPLNHKAKEENEIVKVRVIWSESFFMEETKDQVISLEEYNKRSLVQAYHDKEEMAYCKTKVVLTLANGVEFEYRHDINMNHKTLPLAA